MFVIGKVVSDVKMNLTQKKKMTKILTISFPPWNNSLVWFVHIIEEDRIHIYFRKRIGFLHYALSVVWYAYDYASMMFGKVPSDNMYCRRTEVLLVNIVKTIINKTNSKW